MSRSTTPRRTSARIPRANCRQRAILLDLGSQQTRNRGGAPVPVGGFDVELTAAGARQSVELRTAGVFGAAPFGVEPAGALEALQRDEERAWVDLEDAARGLLDAAGDAEAMHRLEAERLQNQQVER